MSRYSADPRVSIGPYITLVRTARGQVEVTSRTEGHIDRWVAPHDTDGTWSAQDTYHEDVDDAIAAVLERFGAAR